MKFSVILTLMGIVVAVVAALIILANVQPAEVEPSEEQMQVNETKQADIDDGSFNGVGTLAALKNRNTNLECSLTYEPNEVEEPVTGTYFFANGSMRGDFEVPAPEMGGSVVTSVVMDGEMMYVWSDIDGQLFGVKSSLTDDGSATAESQTNTPVPQDVDVRYSCKPWTSVDGSIFVPPSNVLFKDANSLMQAGMEYGTVYEEGQYEF